jgi:hypothetical protein
VNPVRFYPFVEQRYDPYTTQLFQKLSHIDQAILLWHLEKNKEAEKIPWYSGVAHVIDETVIDKMFS